MNAIQACPSPNVLQAMLEGRASEGELDELGRHLDECERCRTRFDDFARGQRVSAAGMARITSAMQSPAFRGALEKLARSPWADEPDEPARDEKPAPQAATLPGLELPSGYLQPTEDPQSLGKLGSYEILERIGSGGMAVVFKGREPRLNRIVAIKVLAPHLAANGTARQRFFREAQAAAAVVHDHVVTIHAVEEASGLPILVMQYVPGASLREKLDKTGPLDTRRVLRIALQTAAGLAAAHAQGLIHRDIKPENILLENGVERVRITDFGLATAADDVALTQTGFLAGTPQYMSPEQAQGRPIDARSDLFSLGSVIYEMCTGRAAFRASNPYAAIHRVCHEQPRPIRQLNPDIPGWLCQIVDRLIDKDATNRYRSAPELIEELQARLIAMQNPHYEEPAETDGSRRSPERGSVNRKAPAPWRVAATAGQHSGRDAVLVPAVLLLFVSALTFLAGPLVFAAILGAGGPGLVAVANAFLCCSVAVPMFVCSLLMLRRSSYPAALCAAGLAMVPITPLFPLTFVPGLFALLVLLRDDVKAAFAAGSWSRVTSAPGPGNSPLHNRQPGSGLQGPALGLQVAAGIAMLFAMMGVLIFMLPLVIDVLEGDPVTTHPPLWALAFGGLFGVLPGMVAVLQFAAAARTLHHDSIVAARLAALCAILPISPACLVGLPMAIWMWVAVHQRWAHDRARPKKPPPEGEQRSALPQAGCVAALVTLFVMTLVVCTFLWLVASYRAVSTPATAAHVIEEPAAPPAVLRPQVVRPESSEEGPAG